MDRALTFLKSLLTGHLLTRAEKIFMALVLSYFLICIAIAGAYGLLDQFQPFLYLSTGAQMVSTFLLGYILYRLIRAGWLLIKIKPGDPKGYLWNDLKRGPLQAEIYLRALPILIGFFVFFSAFTSMKTMIPHVHPFVWDPYFAWLDRALHGGVDPWRLLQPFLGHPVITKILAFIYILWLPVFFFVLFWQLFDLNNKQRRLQFFYTFVLSWAINGTFLAIFFSSAGPCYYEYVTGSGAFRPLMAYLEQAHALYKIYAVDTQALLWQSYSSGTQGLGAGISAFPSVHVATAFLFVLLMWKMNALLRFGSIAFCAAISIGSVHLGWHYAVDGYFSILTTWGIWRGSGRFLEKINHR